MAADTTNPKAHFNAIKAANHFSSLAPATELIARKIMEDTGAASSLSFTDEEVNRNVTQ